MTAILVSAIDPHRRHRFLPRCPVKLLTGLDCPSCGGLRMGHDLLHADLTAAMHDNAFLLLCAPVLGALMWRTASASPGDEVLVLAPRAAYTLASAAMLWMIVRNMPRWPLKPIVRA